MQYQSSRNQCQQLRFFTAERLRESALTLHKDVCSRYYIKVCMLSATHSVLQLYSINLKYSSIIKCFWLGPHVLPCPAWERARYPDLGRTCVHMNWVSKWSVNEKQEVHKLNSRQHGTSNGADAFKDPCGFIWTNAHRHQTTYLLASFDQINLPTYATGASKVYNLFYLLYSAG